MKKKLIAICIMFAFAFAMPAAQAVEPAYVVEQDHGTMQAEAIGKGKVTTAQINAERRSEGAVAASIKETTYSKDGWEDRYVSIGAGSGGVSGGDSIGIGKTS